MNYRIFICLFLLFTVLQAQSEQYSQDINLKTVEFASQYQEKRQIVNELTKQEILPQQQHDDDDDEGSVDHKKKKHSFGKWISEHPILFTAGVLLCISVIFIHLFVCCLCIKRKRATRLFKNQMEYRQELFANSMNMTVLQVRNDEQFNLTYHI